VTRAGLFAAGAAVCAAMASVVSWQTETATTSAPAVGVEPAGASGAQLFQTKGCATCHDARDSTAFVTGGFPSLVDAAAWAGQRRAGMDAEEYVAESIRTPSAFISPEFHGPIAGTEAMPDLGLTEVEIDALVDYLLQG
jgi:cytochrome c551/c552